MKVELTYYDFGDGPVPYWLEIAREPEDRPIYKESTLWYHVKKEFNALGHQFVRQVPEKDGHMYSAPYYLKPGRGSKERFYIIDPMYMINNAATTYREEGHINFDCHRWD